MIMAVDEMVWDLSQLVDSTNPASILKQLENMVSEAEGLRNKYHGKIGGLNSEGVLELLEFKDVLTLKFEGAVRYGQFMYGADSTNETAKQLSHAVRNALMKTGQALAFVDIELGKLFASNPSLVKDRALNIYRHYLERILRRVPHMLSETEEQLIITKDRNGVNSWETLHGDWLSTRMFTLEIKGKKTTVPFGQIAGLYESPDRDLRRQISTIVHGDLGKDEIVWASAMRAICEDHLEMCKIRNWPNPMTQSLIDNDVDEKNVNSLMKTIQNSTGMYQKYLKMKAKLMGLPKLADYDLRAPLPKSPEKTYSWMEARREISSAYKKFDEQIGEWTDDMYNKHHIDGKVRKGKSPGAWCADWLSGNSAYILQSYNERITDVYTQAHELGHAIHAYLCSRAQKPSNCEVGSCVAETGSIFGELLLTEHLLGKTKTREEKQTILTIVLDKFGGAAFQVSARVFFEQSLYDTIKQGTFLDGETAAKLWMAARDKISGDAVEWLDMHKWNWTTTPHYFIANHRFYNYPYVFAQLFVYSLYRLYKEEGKAFVPKMKTLLAAGSSKSPLELSKELGFDITSETFWQKGMKQAQEFINSLQETMQ
jgi:oligoendopeptidase F